MIAVVSLEAHFVRTPDRAVWAQGTYAYPFWSRYLDVFDGVRVVARTADAAKPPASYQRVDGPQVTVAAVPEYLGPWQYMGTARKITPVVREAVTLQDAVIMRVPSQIATHVYSVVRRSTQPYGVEVIGDPWDVFSPGAIKHPLRPFFRMHFTRQLRMHCAGACAAAYVTEHALQRRYPVHDCCFATWYSSVELPTRKERPLSIGVSDVEISGDYCVDPHCREKFSARPLRLIYVGSLSQIYKAPDVLIDAVRLCVRDGLDVHLTIVGEGQYRGMLEDRAARLGIAGRVEFKGFVPSGEGICRELDRAHLFVLPSRTEGLPRAMIEAMARALPCIGSNVGGIPELLPPEDMVPPGKSHLLARKICEAAANPARMEQMSTRNLRRSEDFRKEVLRENRLKFYRFVRNDTEEWIENLSENPKMTRRSAGLNPVFG